MFKLSLGEIRLLLLIASILFVWGLLWLFNPRKMQLKSRRNKAKADAIRRKFDPPEEIDISKFRRTRF